MTDEAVEAVARALCEHHIRKSANKPTGYVERVNAEVSESWRKYEDPARVAITAYEANRTDVEELRAALEPFADRADQRDIADAKHGDWRQRDSFRIDVRLGDCRKARAVLGGSRSIAATLWATLRERSNQWIAVRTQDADHYEVVVPRSQGAILFACETDEHAIIERMADVLAPLCDDDLERAFVVARDLLTRISSLEKKGS